MPQVDIWGDLKPTIEQKISIEGNLASKALTDHYLFCLNRILTIKAQFSLIRTQIDLYRERETTVARDHYSDLLISVNALEDTLCRDGSGDDLIESITNGLTTCLEEVHDNGVDLVNKSKSIDKFQSIARNGNFSMPVKRVFGAVVGALVGCAVGLGVSLLYGLFTGGVGLLSIGINAVVYTFMGAYAGLNIVNKLSANQDDNRGKSVCENMLSISKAKCNLFGSRQSGSRNIGDIQEQQPILVIPSP